MSFDEKAMDENLAQWRRDNAAKIKKAQQGQAVRQEKLGKAADKLIDRLLEGDK